jgi:hypothetical protein
VRGVHISFLQLFLDTHETNISKLPVKTNISDKYLFLRNHMCDGITWLECLYMILYKVYFLFVDWKSKIVTTIGEGLCFRLLRPKGHVSFSQHLVSAVCLFYNVNFSDLDVLWNHWTKLNQTLMERSLSSPLSQLCPIAPPSIQSTTAVAKYEKYAFVNQNKVKFKLMLHGISSFTYISEFLLKFFVQLICTDYPN